MNDIIKEIKQIIKSECDVAYINANIEHWEFYNTNAPKRIYDKIKKLLHNIETDVYCQYCGNGAICEGCLNLEI